MNAPPRRSSPGRAKASLRGTLLACSLPLGAVLVGAAPAPADGDAPDRDLPVYSELIQVFGEAPFVAPVDLGEPVRIVFGIGELEIEAAEIGEVRAELVLDCREVPEDRCHRYKRRLRIEPVRTADGLEVRMAGLSMRTLRRLQVTGSVRVPRGSPLEVKIGIGDVDIRSGEKDLSVRMGIGDLTVRVPEERVGSVSMRTRIGDAGIELGGRHRPGKRRMLIGAKVRWDEGSGDARIDVGLRIGDARVRLE
ncbi:MAG TPA: hypothetical protein VMV46_03235 [Thermoanaerobaculia bacterium]|nr:hypothetical protein [Thermoanaerobaculia bacterium]